MRKKQIKTESYTGNPQIKSEIEQLERQIKERLAEGHVTKQQLLDYTMFMATINTNYRFAKPKNNQIYEVLELIRLSMLHSKKVMSLMTGIETSRGMKYAKQRKEQSANLSQVGA